MQNLQNKVVSRSSTKRVFWRWLLLAAAILLLLLGGLAVFINQRWKPILTRQVQEAILTSTDSLYSISFQNVSLNILTGNATFEKIAFKPDTFIYRRMIRKGKAPKHLFSIEVATLNLKRVHPFKVYYQRKLEMASLKIERPIVKMIYQELSQPENTVIDNRNAYQRLSTYLKSIKIDKIIFGDADFQYIDKSVALNQVTSLQNLDIEITGLLIDSASQFDRSKLYHTEDIAINFDNYEWRSPNGLYDVKIKNFSASSRNGDAKFKGLQLIPRYNEMEFTGRLKTRTGRYALRFDEILLEKINYKAFNTERRLLASKLTIRNSNANIFLNKALPKRPGDHLQSFPQIALQTLKLKTQIDSVLIYNARVSYSEYLPQTQMKGQLFFDQIDGTILNVTNDSAVLAKNNVSKITMTGLIMGRGRFNANLDLNLTQKAAPFTLNGNVGNLDAEKFNKMLRPLTLVEIRSGFIEKMNFSLKGDVNGVQGNLAVNYNDLKISLLAKKEDNSRLRKMNLASMAANVLILKSENPTMGASLRQVKVNYTRPDSVSFISMVWKGMLGGLKETIGLDPKTQRKIEVKLNELKIMKAEREERKTERLKRREERRIRNDR